jgi:exodeoxyribonuclease VII small subunit
VSADESPAIPPHTGGRSRTGRAAALAGEGVSLEELLARLETAIALLAEGTAPLDELVAAHQRATGLLSDAEGRLGELKARADQLVSTLKQ